MKIGIPAETDSGETRVAATPETAKRFAGLGAEVAVEKGAGAKAGILDKDFEAAGAKIVSGNATGEEKAKFLELVDSLTGTKPPKGAQAAWDTRVAALTKASHALLDDAVAKPADPAKLAAFKAAADCKACHTAHKGK